MKYSFVVHSEKDLAHCQQELENYCPDCSCSPKCEICKKSYQEKLTTKCQLINVELLYCKDCSGSSLHKRKTVSKLSLIDKKDKNTRNTKNTVAKLLSY